MVLLYLLLLQLLDLLLQRVAAAQHLDVAAPFAAVAAAAAAAAVGYVKLADLGVSRWLSGETEDPLTFVGTELYM